MSSNKEQPTYYAILTAEVRYNKELTDSEKLLYAEITALCNLHGKCWASNRYFADLFVVTRETISRRISKLRKLGFVTVHVKYKEGSKEVERRYIRLTQQGVAHSVNTPHDEERKDNNTSKNTTSINIEQREKLFIEEVNIISNTLPSLPLEEVRKFCDYWTEPNRTNTKMLCELQKTWDTKRRLGRWLKNFLEAKDKTENKAAPVKLA